MELRVLGPFEAVDGTTPVELLGGRSRALLARLALDANRTVAVDRLIDDLWGEEAPASAPKMVQILVSKLRKTLPPGVLCTRPPGYVVEVPADAIDATRFAALREQGRAALAAGDPALAAERFGQALTLWRGPALAEFSEPFAEVARAHLEETRLICLEDRIEADLALGRHADAVPALESLVAGHPLRESLHGRLMLALYRSGRQAEALAAYERFRRVLDDELGIEPSAAVKELQHGILNQDPGLELGLTARRAGGAATRAGERFVGRGAELARLEAALDAGGTVLVAGEAGIGKSRLVEELSASARARGATVLSGRCIQLVGAGLSYLPLVDALRPLRGSSALEGLDELPRLIPELGLGSAGEVSRLALFEDVLAVLGRLSPVVLCLEDVHWADDSTLDLAAYIGHALRDRGVVLVLTYRSDEVRPGDHLHRLVAGLARAGAAELRLAPLAAEEVERMATGLPRDVARGIAARSEGNPFFARELMTAAARGETELPPALREVLLAHVARVGEAGRGVLRMVAAAGRELPYALLAAAMPLDELSLAGALRDAVEEDVLVADQLAGTFRFRHALLAEAVYATLLPGEREQLHERLARALTEEPQLGARRAGAAEAAQHWAAARRPVEALAASLQAAREAEAVAGLTEALAHVERVLELWDQVPGAEALAGRALPSVVEWAVELADRSDGHDDDLHARELVGALDPGEVVVLDEIAFRLRIGRDAAVEALVVAEHAGLVERVGGDRFRSSPLAVAEARRLYPSAIVLESLAVRQASPLDSGAIAALRAANARFAAAACDPAAAAVADDDFHSRLTEACGNDHITAALRPIKRALLRYERVHMVNPERIAHSAAQHEAIVDALAAGDHVEAAQRLRENLAGGLPDLTSELERSR